jgi:hypothetical protein
MFVTFLFPTVTGPATAETRADLRVDVYVEWRTVVLINDQLDVKFFSMYVFQFSTCFEQPRAHHQENQLCRCNIWYMSLCVGDRLCAGRKGKVLSNLHTKRSPTQSDIYQMLHRHNWFSWWWARGCSKHVENWNNYIKKNCALIWPFTKNHNMMHGQQNIKFYCCPFLKKIGVCVCVCVCVWTHFGKSSQNEISLIFVPWFSSCYVRTDKPTAKLISSFL